MVAVVNELRVWVAMRLAKDLDTCCALLRGEPVDQARLDAGELEFMRAMRFASLETRAIDLFEPQLRGSLTERGAA
jgi:hypothetical protein